MKNCSLFHLLAAGALLPRNIASPVPEEPVNVKVLNKDVMQQHHAIDDFQVLDAFKKQGRANPTEQFDDDGESMLFYAFDTVDWDNMYHQLVEDALGYSPANQLFKKKVESRQFDEEDCSLALHR